MKEDFIYFFIHEIAIDLWVIFFLIYLFDRMWDGFFYEKMGIVEIFLLFFVINICRLRILTPFYIFKKLE